MSQSELVGVLLAANFFDDKELKEEIIQDFADRIKGKPIEEIREVFGIVNDYTPEEEEEVQKLITFKTSDGEEFKLNEAVAVRLEVIKNMVQDVNSTSNVIPLSNVDGKTMTKVIQYWKKYSEEGVTKDQLKSFDQDFLKMSQSELVGVLLAANFFDDKQLKEVIIQEFVDRIKGKPIEKIREVFGIVNDYTLEEEEEVRRENAWAFE
ncbi:SKP1-like protein 5 [Solanum verrucosum]|uniref:SKP1-like protein 5 n=1 Tax=Solanum verrucosum TaxID=315347 RepID=UPI0020D1DBB2|nr:SKP1-like protein 5 [Solanum verrucosum]